MFKLPLCFRFLFWLMAGPWTDIKAQRKPVRISNVLLPFDYASLTGYQSPFHRMRNLRYFKTKSGFIRTLTEKDADEFVCRFAGYTNCFPCACVEAELYAQGYYCDCRDQGYRKDCRAWNNSDKKKSGLYYVKDAGKNVSEVFCDQKTNGGGWMVIQRRVDGTTNFYRNWHEYKQGFGNLTKEFWIGNENLNHLTNAIKKGKSKTDATQDMELWIDMKDWKDRHLYAHYKNFRIGDENSKYQLTIKGFSGNMFDMMSYHSGQPFSTHDADHDTFFRNCAKECRGGWWYKACHLSNLNGVHYKTSQAIVHGTGIHWISFRGASYSLKFVEMKIRRRS